MVDEYPLWQALLAVLFMLFSGGTILYGLLMAFLELIPPCPTKGNKTPAKEDIDVAAPGDFMHFDIDVD